MLVVEDARCVQKTLLAIMARMSIQVDLAEDGHTACRMAEQSMNEGRPYDMIFMDIQMPIMNGLEATHWLREHGWYGPIVALSVYTSHEEQDHFLKAGCNDCLTKPATELKLREVFAKHLGLR
jgi:CheY-like chemotaxis protein